MKWMFVILVLLAVACQSSVTENSSFVAVTEVPVEIVDPPPSPTIAACTPLPEGMTVSIEPGSNTAATVTIEGLEPGELIKLIYEQSGKTTGTRMEIGYTEPIGPDGRFTDVQTGLAPREEGVNQWNVKIIHAQGVACTQFEMP